MREAQHRGTLTALLFALLALAGLTGLLSMHNSLQDDARADTFAHNADASDLSAPIDHGPGRAAPPVEATIGAWARATTEPKPPQEVPPLVRDDDDRRDDAGYSSLVLDRTAARGGAGDGGSSGKLAKTGHPGWALWGQRNQRGRAHAPPAHPPKPPAASPEETHSQFRARRALHAPPDSAVAVKRFTEVADALRAIGARDGKAVTAICKVVDRLETEPLESLLADFAALEIDEPTARRFVGALNTGSKRADVQTRL